MDNWDSRLVDYWDQTTSAINRSTLRLSKLSEPERKAACGQIRDAVRMRVHDLADEQLLQAAVSMVDDLYKYVNEEVLMAAALFESLIMNHAFVDGNKRVAFFATDVFLRLNGWRFEVDANEANSLLIELLESGLCDFEHLSSWIRDSVTQDRRDARPQP